MGHVTATATETGIAAFIVSLFVTDKNDPVTTILKYKVRKYPDSVTFLALVICSCL
jgi:hypothetical protein